MKDVKYRYKLMVNGEETSKSLSSTVNVNIPDAPAPPPDPEHDPKNPVELYHNGNNNRYAALIANANAGENTLTMAGTTASWGAQRVNANCYAGKSNQCYYMVRVQDYGINQVTFYDNRTSFSQRILAPNITKTEIQVEGLTDILASTKRKVDALEEENAMLRMDLSAVARSMRIALPSEE